MEGNSKALLQWTTKTNDLPVWKYESILGDIKNAKMYSVQKKSVLIFTDKNRILFEVKEVKGVEIVYITFAPLNSIETYTIWFNKGSVAGSLDFLKGNVKKGNFDEMFINYTL